MLKTTVWYACSAGMTVFGPVVILNMLGFTATGVAAGSFAAWIQSMSYGGATGGVFSVLQSAAMGGTSAITKAKALAAATYVCDHISEIFP